MNRKTQIKRETLETKIALTIDLDGRGTSNIQTGIGFFDHLLKSFAKHSFIDLNLNCEGDLEVDTHHTIEDVGITLGTAIKEALGDKKSIKRYGYFILPMDEALLLCSLDLSGRPYFNYDVELPAERVGSFECEMVKEFFYAISYSTGMNLHIKMLAGENTHHIIEGIFKAFGKALDEAIRYDSRIENVLSTKGSL